MLAAMLRRFSISLRPPGMGTGLLLAVVVGLIARLGAAGFHWVFSPVMSVDSITEKAPAAGSAETWPGRYCIVVVEMRQVPEECF